MSWLTGFLVFMRIVRSAPQLVTLLAELAMIFAPDEIDRKIENVRDDALAKLERLTGWAREAVRQVNDLDFGRSTDVEQKNARFFEVVERVKRGAEILGQVLGETDARTIAQNAVKLERASGVEAPKEA